MSMKTMRSESGRILRSASNGLGDRQMDAVLSTPAIALDGHKVTGWTFPKNVPLIDTHRDFEGVSNVIGRVVPREEGNRLVGRLSFATAAINPLAELGYQLCLNEFVDSVSVSFIPLEFEYARGPGRRPGAMDIQNAKLLECSICAVGSDENAKIFARAVRAHVTGRETREDRRVLSEAIQRRIARDDRAGGRGWETSTSEERRARAIFLQARIGRETSS